MIETLRFLCRRLAAKRLTVAEAETILGTAGAEAAEAGAVPIQPRDRQFQSGLIVGDPDGLFSYVELTPAGELRLPDLIAAFGEPARPPRLHWDRPETPIFRVGECRLIAVIEDGERVASVKLQPATSEESI